MSRAAIHFPVCPASTGGIGESPRHRSGLFSGRIHLMQPFQFFLALLRGSPSSSVATDITDTISVVVLRISSIDGLRS